MYFERQPWGDREGASVCCLHPGARLQGGVEVTGADVLADDLAAWPSVASAPELPGQQTFASERDPSRVLGPGVAWAFGSV